MCAPRGAAIFFRCCPSLSPSSRCLSRLRACCGSANVDVAGEEGQFLAVPPPLPSTPCFMVFSHGGPHVIIGGSCRHVFWWCVWGVCPRAWHATQVISDRDVASYDMAANPVYAPIALAFVDARLKVRPPRWCSQHGLHHPPVLWLWQSTHTCFKPKQGRAGLGPPPLPSHCTVVSVGCSSFCCSRTSPTTPPTHTLTHTCAIAACLPCSMGDG